MKIENHFKNRKESFSKQNKNKKQNPQLSRKEMRKHIRKQKKQRNKAFHQRYQQHKNNHKNNLTQTSINKRQATLKAQKNFKVKQLIPKNQLKHRKKTLKDKCNPVDKKLKASQIDQKILQQEEQIKYYEEKLGIKQKDKKYKNMMKKMGYDDDLFDFLQNISNKVNMDNYSYDRPLQHQSLNQQSSVQFETSKNVDEESYLQNSDRMEDSYEQENDLNQNKDLIQNQHYNQDYFPIGFQRFDENPEFQDFDENCQDQKELTKRKKIKQPEINQLDNQNKKTKKCFQTSNQQQKEKLQIRKGFTSLFNKLSDGNIMITFRQMKSIFQNHSSARSISVFNELFLKFNVLVEKPHLHILLSNIVLAAGLHQLLGNRLMSPLVSQIIQKFNALQNETQNQEEVQELGYSKKYQKSKNCVLIFSYLYEFGSLTGEFILSFVKQLSKELNKYHIQFLYLIIQKIGAKIRQNDPAVLKSIIDILKVAIESFKNIQSNTSSVSQITKKIDIIQIQLNQLRFNRKNSTFLDQRMSFFYTFINKNIPNQISNQKQILLLTYQEIKSAQKNKTNWWENIKGQHSVDNQKKQFSTQGYDQFAHVDKEKQQLLVLAKSLHLVTEVRKNIFLQIMQSQDYIQASQRVLALKIKNMQQIATVLVQICVLQPTFNPFYPLVASKIANVIPKFRLNIQYAVWDHIKLIDQYNLRKTSNLAKFCSRFVSNPMSNGSLSILKTFPDLINVTPSLTVFLKLFFRQFFKTVKTPYLAKLSQKLQQQNNQGIKEQIQNYLSQNKIKENSFGFQQKFKILRKLLSIQKEQVE